MLSSTASEDQMSNSEKQCFDYKVLCLELLDPNRPQWAIWVLLPQLSMFLLV